MDYFESIIQIVNHELGTGRTLALISGLGSPIHWVVIGVVALLLFGNRLPEVARSLGKAWNEFKRGLNEVSDELNREPEEGQPKGRLQAPDGDDSPSVQRYANGEDEAMAPTEPTRVKDTEQQ